MWEWFRETPTPDLAQARALLLFSAVGIGALIFVLIANLLGVGRRPASHASDEGSRLRRLRRIATHDGLDAADAALLDQLARHNDIQDTARLLSDPGLLGAVLARAIQAVDRRSDLTNPDRQRWLARYFRLEERMERHAAGDPQRRHRRRLMERPCIVTPIVAARRHVSGSQPTAAAVAPERRTMASIMDVSTGGCAFSSLAPFHAGGVARIEFDLDLHSRVVAIGMARHVRPQWPAGTIVHLQFTRVSGEHRNRIHRFVYDHDRRSTRERTPASRP